SRRVVWATLRWMEAPSREWMPLTHRSNALDCAERGEWRLPWRSRTRIACPPIDLAGQVAPTLRIVSRTGLPAFGFLMAVGVVGALHHFDVALLTRDLASLGHVPPYHSAISNIGILFWAMTAALCCFTGLAVTGEARTYVLGAVGVPLHGRPVHVPGRRV